VATCARTLRRLTRFKKLSVVALKNTTSRTSVAKGARSRARAFTHAIPLAKGSSCFSAAAISFIPCLSCVLHQRFFGERAPRKLRRHPALSHHDGAIGDTEDRLGLGGDEENGHALVAQALDDGDDFLLGADVHAARRLVQDEDAGLLREPLGEDDLLLVA